MLLMLKPSQQNGYSSPHAYSPPQAPSIKNFAPSANTGSLPPLPDTHTQRMSTPHRGLPPPSAMTLPNPERSGSSTMSINQSLNSLGPLPPAPSSQWGGGGGDEAYRNGWFAARAEEDRRKQEEEKTRQETLRLEQRKIEQNMLRDSLNGGVPPHMVPLVFAGMSGGNIANASLEWAQHYMAQISIQQQQQQQQQTQVQALPPSQGSPELRRDSRMIAGPQPNPYAVQQPPVLPPPTSVPSVPQYQAQNPPSTSFASPYQVPGMANDRNRTQQQSIQAAPPTSAPRIISQPQQSSLSRLNTGEMQIQPPPHGGLQPPVHTTAQVEQPSTSPSIYFHYWQPPSSKDPPTPSGKSAHESPYSQNASSHLRSEYTNSPKKRKTNSSHPSGSSLPSKTPDTSPSFTQLSSAGRRRAHSNQRSDASSRGVQEATGQGGIHSRPQSRHRQQSTSDSGSQRHASTQPETHQNRDSAGPEKRQTGSGTSNMEAEGPS